MIGPSKEGDQFGYVGQLIDEDWAPEEKTADPIQPPRHEGQPAFPSPGIYFAMPEEKYHAIPAASTSHLKELAVSSMNAWASSWLNLDRIEREEKFFNYGKAIHSFILDGEQAYLDRYAIDLDQAEYGDALVHTNQIRDAIGKFTTTKPVTPKGTKQELIDQLAELGQLHGSEVNLDASVPALKTQIRQFDEETPETPIRKIYEEDEDGNQIARPASKPDWIAQLLTLNPKAKVWDKIVADYRAQHLGKEFLDAQSDRRIRIAAKMIMAHPEIGPLFHKGFPEVSIFWYCKKTGAPMKARIDWLRLNAIIDLKSFSNKNGKPVDSAIVTAIASFRYNMQHVIYDEAAQAARELIREHGPKVVQHCDDAVDIELIAKRDEWCKKWAEQKDAPAFIFVFQQTGVAPVTRGKKMPRVNMGVFGATQAMVTALKRTWIKAATQYGTDPWLDLAPIEEIDDETIPLWATDLGNG